MHCVGAFLQNTFFLFLCAFVLHAVPQEFDASSEMVFAPIVGKTHLADFLRIISIATVCGIRRAPRQNIFFGGGDLLFLYFVCERVGWLRCMGIFAFRRARL